MLIVRLLYNLINDRMFTTKIKSKSLYHNNVATVD